MQVCHVSFVCFRSPTPELPIFLDFYIYKVILVGIGIRFTGSIRQVNGVSWIRLWAAGHLTSRPVGILFSVSSFFSSFLLILLFHLCCIQIRPGSWSLLMQTFVFTFASGLLSIYVRFSIHPCCQSFGSVFPQFGFVVGSSAWALQDLWVSWKSIQSRYLSSSCVNQRNRYRTFCVAIFD